MNAYQLFNSVEPKAQVPALVNTSYETSHPLEPVVGFEVQRNESVRLEG
ncbi:hypothetical protein [Vibrio parahaemolyticus]|nr:hypothetical protein [Vibrio parahaemolyticus]